MTAAPARSAACVVSPHEDDARLAVGFLRENGIDAFAVESLRELAARLDDGIGCAVLMEESLIALELPALREAIARRPAWADLPLIFVAREVAPLVLLGAQAFPDSGNVTLLDRPLSQLDLRTPGRLSVRIHPELAGGPRPQLGGV